MEIGNIVTLKDIRVSEYFSLDEEVREDYHLFFGEVGVVNWADDVVVRVGFVRDAIDFPSYLVELVDE